VTGQRDAIPPILLVGCGRMGSALLAGWEADGLQRSAIVDPDPAFPATSASASFASRHDLVRDIASLPVGFRPRAVVLAVKPQAADAAMAALAERLGDRLGDAVILSIMAGRTLSGLAAALPGASGLVRAMPNTPASIGRGISVAVASLGTSAAQHALCDRLLRAAGGVEWVEDEALLDPVTAVSGSGPAYVFLLAELMEQAGRAQGLPPALARRLARETVTGAGALLAASPDEDAAALRIAVTSPGGTTQAALGVLMRQDAWPTSVADAIEAATERSRALAR
jgi:pyrroline-5-carboxylate reductase